MCNCLYNFIISLEGTIMTDTKFVKAHCKKSDQYFGLEIKQEGSVWKVVNMDFLDEEIGKVLLSQVRQDSFETADNLQPCLGCQSRRVGGCRCRSHAPKKCEKNMPYSFQCIYCDNFEIDYSLPKAHDIQQYISRHGGQIEFQGKVVKLITFSNVTWRKFDNILKHEPAPDFPEPPVHVIANGENIEFHGYNISAMDEGVVYTIGKNDDFEIECDVDTSTISPHPGGYLYIRFGVLTANIDQNGGSFLLDGNSVASVGSRFKMRLSIMEGGKHLVYINDVKQGELYVRSVDDIHITFGFAHDSHCCSQLSHAYLRNIRMFHLADAH